MSRRTLFWAAAIFAAVSTGLVYLWYLLEVAEQGSIEIEIKYAYVPYHYAVHGRFPMDLSMFYEYLILEGENMLKVDEFAPELKDVTFDGRFYRGVIQFHSWPARRCSFSVNMDVINGNAEHYAKKYRTVKTQLNARRNSTAEE
jgi:hypothetical protein